MGLDITLLEPKDFVAFKEDDYKELIPPVFVNRHRINTDHEHVTYTYFATATNDMVKPESEDDIWQWFSKDEIEVNADLRPHVKHYALTALRVLVN